MLNSTNSLMMMHDVKNERQQERTATSRQQRQQGKENSSEVGCAAMNRNRRGGFMFSECCVLKLN
jgi:hypothetical protein